jgi:hypothetical protein
VATIYATRLHVTNRFSEDPHLWRRIQRAESSGGSRLNPGVRVTEMIDTKQTAGNWVVQWWHRTLAT